MRLRILKDWWFLRGGKQVKKIAMEEIAVDFVYSRQQEMKTFSP